MTEQQLSKTAKGAKVWTTLKGQEIPAVVRGAAPASPHAYERVYLRIAVENRLSGGWLVADYPKPVQADKLTLRSKHIPELDGPAPAAETQPLDLAAYSRENLVYQGPHDQARRIALAQWAEQRGYKAFHFTTHHKQSGYHQAEAPEGKEGWTGFLEKAAQYDVYCCYISACAPQPLQCYLEDAAQRGEIHSLNESLMWQPNNETKGKRR